MERTTRRIIVSMKPGVRGTHRSRLSLFVLLGLSAALLLAVLAATGGAMLRSHHRVGAPRRRRPGGRGGSAGDGAERRAGLRHGQDHPRQGQGPRSDRGRLPDLPDVLRDPLRAVGCPAEPLAAPQGGQLDWDVRRHRVRPDRRAERHQRLRRVRPGEDERGQPAPQHLDAEGGQREAAGAGVHPRRRLHPRVAPTSRTMAARAWCRRTSSTSPSSTASAHSAS